MDTNKEYMMIREEIMYMYKIIRELRYLLYITVASVLAFSIKQEEPLFCLVPYCIIFPAYYGTISHEYSMAKLGSYLLVFLEGEDFNWETRSYKFNISPSNTRKHMETSYMPYLATAVACTILFTIKVSALSLSFGIFLRIILGYGCLAALVICMLIREDTTKRRGKYIEEWMRIKRKEESNRSSRIMINAD